MDYEVVLLFRIKGEHDRSTGDGTFRRPAEWG
jgi:hypothetical protein